MTLPDLALQIVYGRLAWAVVAVAAAAAWLPWLRGRSLALAGVLAVALMALPGAASPAYWLTLAVQYPSGLLLGCSLVALHARWRGDAIRLSLPTAVALPIVAIGALLYLDAFGVLALGLYYAGFSTLAVPLLACAALTVCAVAIVTGRGAPAAWPCVAALLLFTVARLPTGNLWDALLDPLVWTWAVVSTIRAVARRHAARRQATSVTEPVPVPAAIEQLQTLGE
jgi:hypothetical protein